MMRGTKFTKTQIEIIRVLLDEEGHSEREIAQKLEKADSNINKLLKDLEQRRVIRRGERRRSKNARTKHEEIPYYLRHDLAIVERILEHQMESTKFCMLTQTFSPSFLWDLLRTQYLASILQLDGEEFVIQGLMNATHNKRDVILGLLGIEEEEEEVVLFPKPKTDERA